jgi:hypothetical protein
MRLEFAPDLSESYLSDKQLGDRWGCHEKTAGKRFRKLGGSTLLLGGSTRYPLSQIIAIERESVSRFAARKTEKPPQFVAADQRRKERREKERQACLVRRQKQANSVKAAQTCGGSVAMTDSAPNKAPLGDCESTERQRFDVGNEKVRRTRLLVTD